MPHSADSQRTLIANLADKIAIQDVIYKYCRGVDRGVEEMITACYHPDAVDDHGNWSKRGDEVGHHITSIPLEPEARLLHFVGNIYSEILGHHAFVESYVLAYRAYASGDEKLTRVRAVRFVDIFERRQGVWKILERTVVDEFNRLDAVLQQQPGSEKFNYSTRDKSDVAYRIKAHFDKLSHASV